MPISYNKLWKKMIDKNMNKTELTKYAGISTNVMAKLEKMKMFGLVYWKNCVQPWIVS